MALRDQCTAQLVKLCRPSRSCQGMPARPGRPPCPLRQPLMRKCGARGLSATICAAARTRRTPPYIRPFWNRTAPLRSDPDRAGIRPGGPTAGPAQNPMPRRAGTGTGWKGMAASAVWSAGWPAGQARAALMGSSVSSGPHGFRRLRLGPSPRRGRWPSLQQINQSGNLAMP